MSSDRRARIRRSLRAAAKGDPPVPSPGPNRAQRRDLVRKNPLNISRSQLRRRGLAGKGDATR